ncbi:MAG: PH domain-containing protein [Saprospiraceae bacterium]
MQEEIIWAGRSSQIVNFKTYLLCSIGTLFFIGMYDSLGFFAVIGALSCIGKMFWAYLTVRASKFLITNKAVIYEYGLLTRTRSFIEMYRIQDTTLIEPLWLRPFGLGTLRVLSFQWDSEYITISAISRPRQVQNLVRSVAEGRIPKEDNPLLDFGVAVKSLN